MNGQLIALFPPLSITLKDGRPARLRLLAPGDGEALAAFFLGVPRHDIRFYAPYPLDREHAERDAAAAHDPGTIMVVLEMPDGGIGGLASCWKADTAMGTFGLVVAGAYQECGAGRALMTRLLEVATAAGPPRMELTVQCANTRAVALYTSLGFTVVREQTLTRDPAAGFADEAELAMEREMG